MIDIKRFDSFTLTGLVGGLLATLGLFIYVTVNETSWGLGLVAIFFYTTILLLIGWKYVQTGLDLFSPVVFMGSFFLLTYPIKGLYILLTGTYGPFVTLNYRFTLNAHYMAHFSESLALSAFCCFVFLWIINIPRQSRFASSPFLGGRKWSLARVFLLMLVISISLLVLFAWLIYSAGGLKIYLQSVAGRQLFFYQRYYIYILIDLFPEVSCFLLAAVYERQKEYPWYYLAVPFVLIFSANLLVSILAGNRSTFLIGFIIPIMVFWHYRVKQIKLSQAVLAVVVILFASFFYISTFRGSNIAEKLSPEHIKQNVAASIQNMTSLFFGGPDLVQADMLIITIQEFPENHEYFAGDSLKALLAFPVPRALYPEKPVRGNWLFTNALFPAWRVNLSGFTVSYLGDWYMNYGFLGSILGMTVLALGLRYLLLHLNPHISWVSAVFYGLVLSSTLSLLRSDILAFVNFALTLFFAVAITVFCSVRKQMSSFQRDL